jgi:predicted ATP-binding protein involved in virulence
MRIRSVKLKNYRMHEQLSVDFNAGFNVIVGVNGSGKTSLLKALCDALNGFSAFLSIVDANTALRDPDVAYLRIDAVNGKRRFEPQYPIVVAAEGPAFNSECMWRVIKQSQVDTVSIEGETPGQAMQQERAFLEGATGVPADLPLPLIAFYRANRQWNGPRPSEMQAATEKVSRQDAYARWSDASVDSSAFQGWVIAKCLERFQTSSETGRAFDEIDDDELAVVTAALRLGVEGFSGLRYDLKQRSLLIEWASAPDAAPQASSFDNLSDGQRAVIGLVGDIARRMCLLNPVFGHKVTSQTEGVVLIDEIDMHLHPRWQRILTTGLRLAFPAIQFIVASHSPQVIGELRPDEIILLRPGGTSHPQISYGLAASEVLEEIMGAEARNPEVEGRLNALYAALERNELEAAAHAIAALKHDVPGLPELVGAEALLKRKQVLGR